MTSRTFNNEEDKKEYFTTIQNFNKDRFDLDIQPSQTPLTTQSGNVSDSTSPEPKESGEGETSVKAKRTRKKSGLFADYNWGDTGVSKLDALFDSLKELAYKRHVDMAGIALRCYVDMLVYEFLRAKNVSVKLIRKMRRRLLPIMIKNTMTSNNISKRLML